MSLSLSARTEHAPREVDTNVDKRGGAGLTTKSARECWATGDSCVCWLTGFGVHLPVFEIQFLEVACAYTSVG